MIRIILVEDHYLVRQGLRLILEQEDDIEVVGEAANGQEALELTCKLTPDVIITDLYMPRLNGLQTAEQIQRLELQTRIVILSGHSDEMLVQQALAVGIKGYLLKTSLTEELVRAIRAVSRGETFLCSAITRRVKRKCWVKQAQADGTSLFERLSPREREVLKLIAEGDTNKAIARELQLSVKTVEKHRSRLMAKLEVHDVASLIRLAVKHGLIFEEE